MKQLIKCSGCEGAGFTHAGDSFKTLSCNRCQGLGKVLEYFGEFAKEERRDDEREARERRKEQYDHEKQYFEFKKYRNRDLI